MHNLTHRSVSTIQKIENNFSLYSEEGSFYFMVMMSGQGESTKLFFSGNHLFYAYGGEFR